MKDKDRWQPAKVVAKTAPQSYIFKMPNGRVYQRNRRYLRKSRNSTLTEYENIEDWSDNDTVVNNDCDTEENTREPQIMQQNLIPPQTMNLRCSQRIIRKPIRYPDSGY